MNSNFLFYYEENVGIYIKSLQALSYSEIFKQHQQRVICIQCLNENLKSFETNLIASFDISSTLIIWDVQLTEKGIVTKNFFNIQLIDQQFSLCNIY